MYECLPPENPLQFLWNVINEGHTFLVKTPTKEPCSVFKICYKNMFSKYLTYIHKLTIKRLKKQIVDRFPNQKLAHALLTKREVLLLWSFLLFSLSRKRGIFIS